MEEQEKYTRMQIFLLFSLEQVSLIAREAAKTATDNRLQQLHLDNRIEHASSEAPENRKKFSRVPPKRIQAKVNVNGQDRWIHGFSQQELMDDYVNSLEREILIQWTGRDKPEIKAPKTVTSCRKVPCPEALKKLLGNRDGRKGYLVWASKDSTHQTPMSYTEARNTFNRVRDRFQLDGYSAHDFRDTCATEWRENGVPLDLVARLLGHAKTETTERRYVKYREDTLNNVRQMM